ncbi:MAG: PAS domain-containing protein [Syntrophobacteraceae bacterium]|nr:PAS domain-containing protein [Syntrophobacteraceae bacterium]
MIGNRTNPPAWPSYLVSVTLVIIAAAIRWQLTEVLGFRATFLTFYPAVAIAALFGGFGPGLLATIASAVLTDYFWIAPFGHFAIAKTVDLIDLVLFLAGAILVVYLIEIAYRNQARTYKAEELVKLAAESENTQMERKRLVQVHLDLIDYAATHTVDELFGKTLDEIGGIAGSPIGFYYLVQRDQTMPPLQQWSTQILTTFCKARNKDGHYCLDRAGHWADGIRQGRPVILNDCDFLENEKGMPGGHPRVVRELVVPVMREGRPVAVVGVGNKQMDYTEKDAETVAYLADVTWEILERKRDEEELRQSEKRSRALIEASSQVLYRMSPDWGQMRQLKGGGLLAGTEKPNPDWLFDYIYPDDQKWMLEAIANAIRTGSVFELEHRVRRSDGTPGWVSSRAVPVRSHDGQIVEWFGEASDITARKLADQKLRESEAFLAESQKISHAGSWSLDLRANRVTWSDEVYRIFGLEPQDFDASYEAFLEAVHPDDREAVDTAYSSSIQEKQLSYESELRIVRKHTGEIRHVLAKCVNRFDAAGEVVRSVGVVVDITERKEAEDALRLSRARLDLALRSAGMGTWQWDISANRFSGDELGCHLLGIDSPTFAGTQEEVFRAIHVEDRDRVRRSLGRALKQDMPFEAEHRSVQTDGKVIHIAVRGRLARDTQGRPERINGLVWDITERKQMENELRRSRDELELRVRERTADLKSANEKLRLVPSRLIEAQESERQRLSMELHDSVGQTLAALKFRIEHVIDRLEKKEYSRPLDLLRQFVPVLQRSLDETRAIYMGLRPTILTEHGILTTLDWYRRELLKLYPNPHIELETRIEEEDIPEDLKIVIFRIAQEAMNNALKHGKPEWVDVRLALHDGVLELEISDDGIGMDLDLIMESRAAKSLGLMGMKERAELCGGQFSIISAPREGTTVKAVWRNL